MGMNLTEYVTLAQLKHLNFKLKLCINKSNIFFFTLFTKIPIKMTNVKN